MASPFEKKHRPRKGLNERSQLKKNKRSSEKRVTNPFGRLGKTLRDDKTLLEKKKTKQPGAHLETAHPSENHP